MEPPIQSKIEALIRRLASDSDGEVLACVAALRRQLAAAELDFNDLAEMFMAPKQSPASLVSRDQYAQVLDWIITNKFSRLSVREQEFVTSMTQWVEFSYPTQKQRAWIKKIVEREGAVHYA